MVIKKYSVNVIDVCAPGSTKNNGWLLKGWLSALGPGQKMEYWNKFEFLKEKDRSVNVTPQFSLLTHYADELGKKIAAIYIFSPVRLASLCSYSGSFAEKKSKILYKMVISFQQYFLFLIPSRNEWWQISKSKQIGKKWGWIRTESFETRHWLNHNLSSLETNKDRNQTLAKTMALVHSSKLQDQRFHSSFPTL